MALFDDFTSSDGWTSDPAGSAGYVKMHDGVLSVFKNPNLAFGQSVGTGKTYQVDVLPNTSFHTLVRIPETLLGADMYITVSVDNAAVMQLGVNGEQHWEQFVEAAKPKSLDDECFFGTRLIVGPVGGGKDDMRVTFADGIRFPYSQWFLVSIKYQQVASQKQLRLLINGRDVVYRVIDAPFPAGSIDMHTNWQPKAGPNEVRFSFGLMSDGDGYADTSRPNGVNYRRVYAAMTPARPTFLAHPKNKEKLEWMKRFDAVAACNGDRNRIWQGIYSAAIDGDTAILMGAIEIPGPEHPQWGHAGPGARDKIVKRLYDQTHGAHAADSLPKQFAWTQVETFGFTSLAVHHRYLTPEEVRKSPQWQFLSESEKAEIPEPATYVTAEIQADMFCVCNPSDVSVISGHVSKLINDGKISKQTAELAGLL